MTGALNLWKALAPESVGLRPALAAPTGTALEGVALADEAGVRALALVTAGTTRLMKQKNNLSMSETSEQLM